jgi:hypothetical protein
VLQLLALAPNDSDVTALSKLTNDFAAHCVALGGGSSPP